MPPKPATTSTTKTNTTGVKPASTTVVKPASTTAVKPATNLAQKPATSLTKPLAAKTTTIAKPAVISNTAKTNVTTSNVKVPVGNSIKPAEILRKPAVNNTSGIKSGSLTKTNQGNTKGISVVNKKLDPIAAKKKDEEEKKQAEEKLKEQKLEEEKRLEEEAQQKKEEEERKIKEEEDRKVEEENKKKEEEEKQKQEAIAIAEKQYKEAKLLEEKRVKEEQEKLKNGKIFVKTNTGGLTSTVEFKIVDGSISYSLVDDELALEFAYEKGYQFFLTGEKDKQPDESKSYFSQGSGKTKTFNNLQAGTTYWCVVLKNDAAESKRKAYKIDENAFGSSNSNNNRGEGCSCLYGNPCIDQYICQDWNNRFTVAKNNLNKK